ncbi:MAG TPA: LuxR C-terminal-related transcriptional regulator [Polyangium sp.]|nr:LuxR C-terminal-related transcriptional regulator [Polyangium sp.]
MNSHLKHRLTVAIKHARETRTVWSSSDEKLVTNTRNALRQINPSSSPRDIIESIRILVPVAAGMIEGLPAARPEEPSHFLYDMPEGFVTQRARLIAQDPSLALVAECPSGIVLRGLDVFSVDEFQALEYNQRVYKSHGLDNVTGLILSKEDYGSGVAPLILWLFSGSGTRLPTWEECRRLELVSDDLRDAAMRSRVPLFVREPMHFQSMQEEGTGYMLLRPDGTVIEINRKAVLLLQDYSESPTGSWRKQVESLSALEPVEVRRGKSGRYFVKCRDNVSTLEINVHWFFKSSYVLGEDVKFVKMREMPMFTNVDAFQVLSKRQREIALLLVNTGWSYQDLARKLFIAEGTMRKHVEMIYRALNVASRFQLNALAKRGG